jgi:hypothetical protein
MSTSACRIIKGASGFNTYLYSIELRQILEQDRKRRYGSLRLTM